MVYERASDRTKTSLPGRIVRADQVAIDCLIKDMSDGGAKIEVQSGESVPSTFELQIPRLGVAFHAETRWRYAHSIGVKFTSETAADCATDAPTREELLAENAWLQDIVHKLASRLTQLGEPVMLELKPRRHGDR